MTHSIIPYLENNDLEHEQAFAQRRVVHMVSPMDRNVTHETHRSQKLKVGKKDIDWPSI